MKLIYRLLGTVLFILLYTVAHSQTTIKGRVVDQRTRSPLPYCTIYFGNKKIGTKTDGYGNFTLKSSKSESSFFVSYLGYETKEVKIYGTEFKTEVVLAEKAKKKQAVDIKGNRKQPKDTLAIRIIRNTIKNKDNNKISSFETVQFDKYSKFELSLANVDSLIGNNFLTKPLKYILDYQSSTPDGEKYSPILLRETSTKEYRKGTKVKTEILGQKDTRIFDNESIYGLIEQSFEDYSIYDNQLIIANKSILSPLSGSALMFYRYYVEDSFEVDGKKNYQMIFAPISKEDFGFTGKLIIEEGSWAVKESQIYLDKRANINWINHFALAQSFKNFNGKWLKYRDEKDIALALNKSKKRLKARFRQTDILSNFAANLPIDDAIFSGDEVVRLSNYNTQNDSFWSENRAEKLSSFEEGIYTRADTFKRSKQYKTIMYFSKVGTTAFLPVYPVNWEFGRIYKFVSWNEYEGTRLRLGARMVFDSFKKFNIGSHIAYGTLDKKLKFGVNGFFNLPTKNLLFHQITVNVMHDYDRLGEAESLMDFDNVALSIFRKPSNRIKDIILKDQVKFNWIKEWRRGEETQLGFDHTTFHANSYFKLEEYINDTTLKARDQINSFRITASYRFAMKEPVFRNAFRRIRLKSIRPVFEINSSVGIKGFLGSDYSFLKLKASAKQQVPYVFGQFRYNLSLGKIFGKVPYIDIEPLGGNNSIIRDQNRFFLMNEAEYMGDMYAQLYLSQHFQGYFFNKVPLLKKLGWRENVYFRTAVASINEENLSYIKLPNQTSGIENIYMETGFGVSNIFKFLEVHGIWRLTQHDKRDTRKFGILLGASFEI